MKRRGFTLVELLIVMVIIGILLSMILRAYTSGIRTAELKATESLVAKLEQAMTDRVDALTTYQAAPTPIHIALASLYNNNSRDENGNLIPIPSTQRAQVIAQYDYLRSQLPDVFAVQTVADYPLNFAGQAFAGNGSFAVPLGADNGANGTATGMYGAAFEIAGGIYKQLGYGPKGYDGNDNDGDGLVDERGEGEMGLTAEEIAVIDARLARHTHKTARAEMLYAILVEGGGTYGSAFNKDDFTAREVKDTDGDGLMEFVDAWGEPLQFYRWPILYRSDLQKGYPDTAKLTEDSSVGRTPGPYNAYQNGSIWVSYETREQNPLDPNQTLIAPAWWGAKFNDAVPAIVGTTTGAISGQALTFMTHFGPCLVDPLALNVGAPSATFWDRSTGTAEAFYTRRAYYSRFLILSAGPDKTPGTAQLTVNYPSLDDRATVDTPSGAISGPGGFSAYVPDGSGAAVGISTYSMLLESQGGRVDLNRPAPLGSLSKYGTGGRNDTNSLLDYFAQDDITNHGLQSTGGVVQ